MPSPILERNKFACRFCSKRFALEQYKKEHEYIHTNETPYICGLDGCTEAFRQRAKLCLHRMSHKNYKKKSYKVYSRKDTIKKTIWESKPTVSNLEMFSMTPQLNSCSFTNFMFDQTTQEMMNSLFLGYDCTNLITTLSFKYCICDYLQWSLGYQYPGYLDPTYMYGQATNMEKIKSNLSTLKIPKGSFSKSSSDQSTPSTITESPTPKNCMDSQSVRKYVK